MVVAFAAIEYAALVALVAFAALAALIVVVALVVVAVFASASATVAREHSLAPLAPCVELRHWSLLQAVLALRPISMLESGLLP